MSFQKRRIPWRWWENWVWNKVNQGHEKVSCVKQGNEVIKQGQGLKVSLVHSHPPSGESSTRMNWLLSDSSLKGTYSYVYTSQKRVLYKKN